MKRLGKKVVEESLRACREADRVLPMKHPIPLDRRDIVKKFCAEVGRRAKIDPERLSVTKTYLNPDDMVFRRTVFLDGKPIAFKWNMEAMQDKLTTATPVEIEERVIQGAVQAITGEAPTVWSTKENCPLYRALNSPVGIECEHGYDVCPKCDPCTCGEHVGGGGWVSI